MTAGEYAQIVEFPMSEKRDDQPKTATSPLADLANEESCYLTKTGRNSGRHDVLSIGRWGGS